MNEKDTSKETLTFIQYAYSFDQLFKTCDGHIIVLHFIDGYTGDKQNIIRR